MGSRRVAAVVESLPAATNAGEGRPPRRTASSVAQLGELADPRSARQKRPQVRDVRVIALGAVLWGAAAGVAVATCGQSKPDGFPRFWAVPKGSPSPDPCGRVFALRSPGRW